MRAWSLQIVAFAAFLYSTGCSSGVKPVDTSKPLPPVSYAEDAYGTAAPLAETAGESEKPAPKAEKNDSPSPSGSDKSITFGSENRSIKVPDGFVMEKPSSSMRMFQASVPHPSGGHAAAELVGFALGGTLEANIERWKGQCGGADSFKGKQEIDTASSIKATICEFEGTYTPMVMPGQTAAAVPDARMYMAVIFTEQAQYQIRLVGPKATMDANKDKFFELVKSFK